MNMQVCVEYADSSFCQEVLRSTKESHTLMTGL